MNKKAVIIGTSSGIGHALSKTLAHNDYTVGLVGRRFNLLTELQKELPGKSFVNKTPFRRALRIITQWLLANRVICHKKPILEIPILFKKIDIAQT